MRALVCNIGICVKAARLSIVAGVLWCGLGVLESHGEESWESVPRLSTQFLLKNEHLVVSASDVETMDSDKILGLELTDQSTAHWNTFAQQLTNVVYLKITTTNSALGSSFFSTVAGFQNLNYLHLDIRNAAAIPPAISAISKLSSLDYIALDCPSATTISSNIYLLTGLEGLLIRAGDVDLPSGVSRLKQLERLEILGSQDHSIRSLPKDLSGSPVKRLEVLAVTNLHQILTGLPSTLLELRVGGCRLESIPKQWLPHLKLEVLDFNGNQLTQFPTELLKLPSIRLIGLDLNKITNIPPVKIPLEEPVKISVLANPIRTIAEENRNLIERGIIKVK